MKLFKNVLHISKATVFIAPVNYLQGDLFNRFELNVAV